MYTLLCKHITVRHEDYNIAYARMIIIMVYMQYGEWVGGCVYKIKPCIKILYSTSFNLCVQDCRYIYIYIYI